MGSIDWRTADLCINGDINEWPGRCVPYDCSRCRQAQRHATGSFYRDQLDPKQIGPVPSNAIIVNQTPQLEVLKRTSVCITHAGLNTVLESLAQGVPQLAIPVTFEQPGIAARIAAKKTGVAMSFADLTSEHLSTLLDEVLNCSIYRENARKFQEIISKTNGLAIAANIVERCFGVIQESAF